MKKTSSPIKRLTLIFTWSFASIISVLAPTGYYLVASQYLRGVLDAQAELSALEVSAMVVSNPAMWRFEQHRLAALLERKTKNSVAEIKCIIDKQGEVIAHNADSVSPPLITRQHDIYDAGTVVASIQISRSLKPILLETLFVAACALLASASVLLFLFKVPLNAIQKAYQSLSESEDKYRSLYAAMKEGLALHRITFDDYGAMISFTVTDANPVCIAMFGHTEAQIIGRNSFELFGDSFRKYQAELFSVLGNETSTTFEYSPLKQERVFTVQAFSPGPGLIATLFEEITERKKSELQIVQMAYYDALTGLPNRTLMLDRLNRAIAHSERDQETMGVLFLDLDRFKIVNDTLGHSMGDRLLLGVSERLSSLVRSSDTLARIGGDEFVVIVSELDKEVNAAHIAQKMIDSLCAPFNISGRELHISTSIGIAVFPEDGTNAETLLMNADMAMYSAKDAGRNSYNFYSLEMNHKAHERMKMEESIRGALERNEFFLEYQPIMDPKSLTVSAAEALIRWNHPIHGRIAPDQFITIAEDAGLIIPLGEWVLSCACNMIEDMRKKGLPPVRIAVNVSSKQIQRQNFAAVVLQTLQSTGADPSLLEIEFTESCLIKDSTANMEEIFGLRERGVSIAIDDFGTGYSSLGYIKTLPIDHIKIDRSFIKDITTNPNDQAIVELIITMSQKLGIRNIAEGVETAEQLEFLKELSCEEIQGYYFHRPLSVEALETLLRNQSKL